MNSLVRKDILYPELSYQLVGILFKVHNSLGHNYLERYYQSAIAEKLREAKLQFNEQVEVKLTIDRKEVAKGFIDFVVDDKIILEIKRGERFLKQNIDQVNSYLKMTGLKLAILANFTSFGLQYKRLVNIIANSNS